MTQPFCRSSVTTLMTCLRVYPTSLVIVVSDDSQRPVLALYRSNNRGGYDLGCWAERPVHEDRLQHLPFQKQIDCVCSCWRTPHGATPKGRSAIAAAFDKERCRAGSCLWRTTKVIFGCSELPSKLRLASAGLPPERWLRISGSGGRCVRRPPFAKALKRSLASTDALRLVASLKS